MWKLDGQYYPSSGLTTESMMPFAVNVMSVTKAIYKVDWVSKKEMIKYQNMIRDGYLRGLLRAGKLSLLCFFS